MANPAACQVVSCFSTTHRCDKPRARRGVCSSACRPDLSSAPARGQRAIKLSYAPKITVRCTGIRESPEIRRSRSAREYARTCGASRSRQRPWQIVDQRDIAEPIAPVPEDAVRLEGIAAIGDEDHGPAARTQHPRELGHGLPVVGDVLEHLVGQDQVEAVVGERQTLAGGAGDGQSIGAGLAGARGVELNPARRACVRCKSLQVQPEAAAVIQHASGRPLSGGGQNHLQSALLPGAPDVRRLAAQRGELQIALGHPSVHSCWKPNLRRLSIRRIQVGTNA